MAERRRRCDGPCGDLYPPMQLVRVGRKRLCEGCLNELADEAIGDGELADAKGRPEAEHPAAASGAAVPFRTAEEAAEATVAAIRERRGEGPVTMYATPGRGDGTPCTVPISDVRARLLDGWGILQAQDEPPPVLPCGCPVGLPEGHQEGCPVRDAQLGVPVLSPREVARAVQKNMLPAPSTQPNVAAPDLRSEDEKVRDWTQLPDVKAPGWPLKRGRISASALGTFARCPEQFRQKHVLGKPDPWGGAGLAGTAVHKALAQNWIHKMSNGEDAPLADLEEGFDAAFDGGIAREEKRGGAVDWGHDGSQAKRPMDEDSWRGRGKEALGSYMLHVGVNVWPRAAEDLFIVQVADLAVPVVGFIDLVTDRAMVDQKFGGKKQRTISPEWRIQGLTYLLARDLPMTWHSMNWKGEFHTPSDAPGLILPRTAESYAIALDLIRSSVSGILAYADRFGLDQPWPGALSHTWACNTCSFEPTCWWWHRPFHGDGSGSLL